MDDGHSLMSDDQKLRAEALKIAGDLLRSGFQPWSAGKAGEAEDMVYLAEYILTGEVDEDEGEKVPDGPHLHFELDPNRGVAPFVRTGRGG